MHSILKKFQLRIWSKERSRKDSSTLRCWKRHGRLFRCRDQGKSVSRAPFHLNNLQGLVSACGRKSGSFPQSEHTYKHAPQCEKQRDRERKKGGGRSELASAERVAMWLCVHIDFCGPPSGINAAASLLAHIARLMRPPACRDHWLCSLLRQTSSISYRFSRWFSEFGQIETIPSAMPLPTSHLHFPPDFINPI